MYKIPLNSINQFDSEVFFGSIEYLQLLNSVKITARKNNSEFFQRETLKKDYSSIKEFIEQRFRDNDSTLPFFPTPLILGVELEEHLEFDPNDDREVTKYYLENEQNSKAIFCLEKKILYIPEKGENNQDNILLIIDGQHRFLGLKSYFEKYGYTKFHFLATFMIGNDRFEQSIIFSDVNFNQKPVNKSLMYDILGVLPNKKNEVSFTHNLVKKINENLNLKGIIKILGTGYGIISLGFIVEVIINQMITHKNGSLKKFYEQYEFGLGNDYEKLEKIFIDYFLYIKEKFPKYFPNKSKVEEKIDGKLVIVEYYKNSEYKYILFKTTGIYGWLLLLNDILPKVDVCNYNKDVFIKQLDLILIDIVSQQDIIFNEHKPYMSGGSKSLQTMFYNELKRLANFDGF